MTNNYRVWYMKKETFPKVALDLLSDKKTVFKGDIKETHVYIGDVEAESVNHVFAKLNCEPYPALNYQKAEHTSMMPGDIIELITPETGKSIFLVAKNIDFTICSELSK